MFNLLPLHVKDKIKAEYKIRFAIVALVVTLFVQVAFLASLFPSWLISRDKEQDALLQTDMFNQSNLSKGISSIAMVIAETNQKLKIINSKMEYPLALPLINGILSRKTSVIRLNSFLYTSADTSSATLSIAGVSGTREALIAFKKNLEDSGLFASVDLPVSNFTKDKDLDFSMNLSVSQ